jgi:hypothetical protein
MKKIRIVSLFLALALLQQSCDTCERGSGSITTENRTLSNFTSIELKGSSNVEVRKSSDSDFKVEVYEYANLQSYIVTEVVNNELVIRNQDGTCVKNSRAKITVYMPDPLYKTYLSGSGNIDINAEFLDLNEVNLSGSGNINANYPTNPSSFLAYLSGSGNIEIASCNSQNLDTQLRGSGNITVKAGATNNLISNLTGSGNIRLFSLAATAANCTLTGSGNIEVNASSTLSATLSGSGDIVYMGSPTLTQTRTGSGNIRRR